jgi:hypothetical protein
MKVYVVHSDLFVGGSIIDKIFDNERKALDYVIKKYYSGPFYTKMIPAWLDDNAHGHIEEKELE